jgi:DNA-binding transcriptional LysR family regulator
MLTVVNLSSIDLNLLLVLHAVLEEKSVVAAARSLHVTPPAVSNALARLRVALADPLFVRKGRGLVATPRTLELAPVVARMVAELGRALGQAESFDPKTSLREFTIALADNDQIALLPQLAQRFALELPRARLRAVSIDALISAGGLASPLADLTVAPALDEPDLHREPLYEEEAVVVLRSDHPAVPAKAKKLSHELFCSLRHVDTHIALGRPGVGHRTASDVFAKHGLTRDVALTVPSFSSAVMVAAESDLVAAVPSRVAQAFAKRMAVRSLQLPAESPKMALYAIWHERTHRDSGARFLRALVKDASQQLKKRGSGRH